MKQLSIKSPTASLLRQRKYALARRFLIPSDLIGGSLDLRTDLKEKEAKHEGELTAALRLIDRLHELYGRFIITKNKKHDPIVSLNRFGKPATARTK